MCLSIKSNKTIILWQPEDGEGPDPASASGTRIQNANNHLHVEGTGRVAWSVFGVWGARRTRFYDVDSASIIADHKKWRNKFNLVQHAQEGVRVDIWVDGDLQKTPNTQHRTRYDAPQPLCNVMAMYINWRVY